MAIFGNRAVMNTNAFGSIAIDRVVRLEPPVLDAVHAMYNDIALFGKRGTPTEVAFLERTAPRPDRPGRRAGYPACRHGPVVVLRRAAAVLPVPGRSPAAYR